MVDGYEEVCGLCGRKLFVPFKPTKEDKVSDFDALLKTNFWGKVTVSDYNKPSEFLESNICRDCKDKLIQELSKERTKHPE